jgi:citrate synthase
LSNFGSDHSIVNLDSIIKYGYIGALRVLKGRYVSAAQAANALGVSKATLYCYVSRGMLRSEPIAGEARKRHYVAEDVVRLAERKDLRRDPAKAAARGLHWGAPVLDSSLSLISEGRLFYRGVDALDLAQRATVEEVAALLWIGDSAQAAKFFARPFDGTSAQLHEPLNRLLDLGPIERCQLVLASSAPGDLGARDLRPVAVARTGARILQLVRTAICGAGASETIDAGLAAAWTQNQKAALPCIRAALILCADHELNVSAFTARAIASARATPYEVVLGALAAFSGRRHGGASDAVSTLLQETSGKRRVREILAKSFETHGGIPGFGHPLYPEGDPRAALLLSLAKTHGRKAAMQQADGLAEAVHGITGEQPNLDFGLVVLARALDLPIHAPIALFALGRTIGWIAHAIEQYAEHEMIRPRARYVGLPPAELPTGKS